ncbi:MazG-like family protein [Oenococcus kitaharae]|uniref:MazG-like family protein n=1 Tax=Oenococcus TaxID=46254 RepID=UPI0021E6F07E|nr:MazG-like family protein [Oenococcus kitaharae]MCV3296167.1 MazG-like family protein [Oenococcus kitaharae]
MNNLIEKIRKAAVTEPKKPEQQFMKLSEELGEACQAYLSSQGISGNKYKGLDQDNVKEELVDVIMVAIALLCQLGTSNQDIENLVERKIHKWVSKQQH